jgi:diketogulonate reductase-like aldo/keto reductase
MQQAMAALSRERLACNQVLYNLRSRGIERDLVPFCEGHGIAVVGYTPFGGLGRSAAGMKVLAQVGARHGATPHQVALGFLTRQPGLFAIPKASDPDHVRDNAAAAALTLSAEDLDAIDRAFPAPRRQVPLALG